MTCIEEEDLKVLKKYEPFGLVLFKIQDLIGIPEYIFSTYYDIYKEVIDPISSNAVLFNKNYYINSEKFKKLMVLDI
jgi:hypothetical protein